MSLSTPLLRLNRSRFIHIPRLQTQLARPQLRPIHLSSPARFAPTFPPALPNPSHPPDHHNYDLDLGPEADIEFIELLSMTGGQLPTPLRVMKLNESVTVAGSGSKGSPSSYECTRKADHFYCTCMAWKMQNSGKDIQHRTCKHLRQLLGDKHEDARCGPATTKASSKSKSAKDKTPKASTSKKHQLGPPPPPAPKKPTTAVPVAKPGPPPPSPSPDLSEGSLTDPEAGETKVAVLLAHKFDLEDGKRDPTGWWMSEKLDGIRAFYDGKDSVYSRLGKKFYPPKEFVDKLPKGISLDGELFIGRDSFDATSSVVRSYSGEGWEAVKYMVFDLPSETDLTFEERQAKLHELFPEPLVVTVPSMEDAESQVTEANAEAVAVVEVVKQVKCRGLDHLKDELRSVQAHDGEGLMLRQPGSFYVGKRSTTLLKVKTFYDAEARVIGYKPGKNKYVGMTGSLTCEMENGKTFDVGSGLTDHRRTDKGRPKIGAIINYRFQELTKSGVPRFPTFVGERIDATEPKDALVRPKSTSPDA